MSFITDANTDDEQVEGLDALKPPSKVVSVSTIKSAKTNLNFIDKLKSDLDILKMGKTSIEKFISEQGDDVDEKIVNQFRSVTKSIERIEKTLQDYEDGID